MRILVPVIIVLGVLAAMPAGTFAQDVGPLSARRQQQLIKEPPPTPRKASIDPAPNITEADCDRFVLAPDIEETSKNDDLEVVAACLNLLNGALEAAAEAPSSAELNREIIRMRINYKRLKKWIPGKPTDSTGKPVAPSEQWNAVRRAQLRVGEQLPIALKKHDLFATFSAILVTGATLLDANQPESTDETASAAATENKAAGADQDAQALGTIIWQSRHFGDESIRSYDWSVGGRIGLQPVLNLVTDTPPEDAPEGTPPVVGAVHQNAFLWTFGVQFHVPIRGINSEFGAYGSTGSATLSSLPKAVDKGQGSFLAFPLDYGAQKTAWMWESGVTFNIFDNPLEQIHAEKGTTSPQFQALVAIRRDERFRGSIFDDYEQPTGRLLFRLTLDAIRVFDRRQFGEASKPFTFGFVVEHERSLATSGTRVPSATRFVLRGDINLLKALSGTPEEKRAPDETPVAQAHVWTVTLPGPAVLPLTAAVASATVTLTRLTVSGNAIESTPPPSVTVTADKGGTLDIPACAGATMQFTLSGKTLALASKNAEGCTGTAVFSVQEGSKN